MERSERAEQAGVEMERRPERDVGWEVCKQACKLVFGAAIITVLAIMNANLHQLLLCVMRSPLENIAIIPIDHVISPPINCTSHHINPQLKLRLEICDPPAIRLVIDSNVLRTYSGSDALVFADWLRRCLLYPCPTYMSSVCPRYVPYSDAVLCFDDDGFDFLVINGLKFPHAESVELITYIVDKVPSERSIKQ